MSILGLDIGTTGVKAVVFTKEGKFLTSAYREYNLNSPREGELELAPEDVLKGAREAVGEVVALTSDDPIESMSTSTMGELAVPVDENNRPLGPAIVGFDSRGQEEMEEFKTKISNEDVFDIAGHGINSYHTLFKIMWRRKHEPEIFNKTHKYLCFGDFIMASLGLEPHIDYSMAARTLGFDIHEKDWSQPVLDAAGLTESFAKPIPAGYPVGKLEAGNCLGLPKGCVVSGGLHDQPAGILGAGIKPGESMLATGTVVCLGVRLQDKPEPGPMRANNLCYYPTFGDQQWISIAWNFTGGSLLKWYRDTFGAAECVQAEKEGVDPYEIICDKLPENPTGLLILPHFTTAGTPTLDPKALGTILGLRLTTTRQEIVKAILEGVAFEIALNADLMSKSNIQIQRYKAIGGAAKSKVWMQIYADILNRPVVQLEVTEGAALGVALLGAYGAGILKSEDEVYQIIDERTREGLVFDPNSARVKKYQDRFEIYREIYNQNMSLNHKLWEVIDRE